MSKITLTFLNLFTMVIRVSLHPWDWVILFWRKCLNPSKLICMMKYCDIPNIYYILLLNKLKRKTNWSGFLIDKSFEWRIRHKKLEWPEEKSPHNSYCWQYRRVIHENSRHDIVDSSLSALLICWHRSYLCVIVDPKPEKFSHHNNIIKKTV